MTEAKLNIAQGSPEAATIRAAYEVLLGCLQSPSIAKELDTATVEKIAQRLNDLLPGDQVDQVAQGETPVENKTVGALWKIEQSRRLRLINAVDKGTARVEVYLADLNALMRVQVPA